METKDRKITELKPALYNPRKITEKQLTELKASIMNFGFVEPVIINMNKERKNVVISGHQRLKIAKELKLKVVPCVELDLDTDKERELNVRMNKAGGEFDFDLLEEFYSKDELIEFGFDEVSFSDEVKENKTKTFEDEFNEYNDGNCEKPIVPDFFEKHECFIIPVNNEIDEKFIRDVFDIDKNFISNSGDKKERLTNVISVERVRGLIND